tara:strand:+ start:2211 stop:2375 length:165 start_codon:yes stop_codon:yes gene_type:complete
MNNYKEWRLNMPHMLREVAATDSNVRLAWNAAKIIDLYLIKLTGRVPRGSSGKG